MMSSITIRGYRRGDGSYGVRNHVIVLSCVSCANSIVEQLAAADRDVVPITHQHGCTHLGDDREQVLRTLAGTCANANVGAALLVGLGCESTGAADVAERVPTEGRMVRTLVIQDLGRRRRILEAGLAALREMKQFVAAQEAQAVDISHLTVGLECGGSDPFSGITANPAVGLVSDRLVGLAATVILSETPEMIGAEGALAGRLPDESVKRDLFARIAAYVGTAKKQGTDLRGVNPTPGNIRAGLSSIEEKSLGCIVKGGHTDIGEVVGYACRPTRKGLVVMDTPGNDPESITGMVAGGAQVVLFTTGVGTPLGNPIAPVVKICSNSRTYGKLSDFIDVNAGKVIEGAKIEAVAEEIFDLLVRVCSGERTAAEVNGCREFAINRIGATF